MVRHRRRITPAVVLTVLLAAAAPAAAKPLGISVNTSGTPTPGQICTKLCAPLSYVRAEKTVVNTGISQPASVPGAYVRAEKTVVNTGTSEPAVTSGGPSPVSEVVSGHGYGNPAAPAAIVRTVAPSNGFDWGDAAIGAGGALVLMLVISGGVLGITNNRRHAARGTA
jgi:hypothetical protein